MNRVLLTSLLTATSLWICPLVANAQIVQAVASMNGLTCPFCSFGAEKQIKKVGGVQKVNVNIDAGTATITARPGQSIDVGQLPSAIKSAGFVSRNIRIVAIGTVATQGNNLSLQLRGQNRSLILAPSQNQALVAKLQDAARQRTTVEINGDWRANGNTLIADSVKQLP